MADFYINSLTGDDSNPGTELSPFETFHKTLRTAISEDSTVYVAAGNYYKEGNTIGFIIPGGYDVKFIAQGQINIRVYETPVYGTYCWRFGGGSGTYLFTGSFKFDMDYLGDGSDNTGKYFWYGIPSLIEVTFLNNTFDGGGNNRFVSSTSGVVIYDRCYVHNFTGAFTLLVSESNLTFKSCYLKDMAGLIFGSNASNVTLSLLNNTFDTIGLIAHSGTTTYTSITIKNNIMLSTATTKYVLSLKNASAYDVTNNAIWKTASPPEPRTSVWYQGINIDDPDYYDSSYFIDPEFSTAPELVSTSLTIGRGASGGPTEAYILDGNGASTFSIPSIGCWMYPSGTKQYITPTDKKVAVVGNSITYGTGASSAANAYGGLLLDDVDLFDYTFITMPGASSRLLGIIGCQSKHTHLMAQEFAVSGLVDTVTLYTAVNDINAGDLLTTISNQIIATLDNLVDLGITNVIYAGTGIEDSITPVYSSAVTVEQTVAANCAPSVIKIDLAQKIIIELGWQSFYADAVHPNNSGHSFIEGLIKFAILAARIIISSKHTLIIEAEDRTLEIAEDIRVLEITS